MFYTTDRFDTFITHLIKLWMQSRQEPNNVRRHQRSI